MGPLIAAWLVGEGIICYRTVKNLKAPPGPGQLLISSGVFVLLALLAESSKARPAAIILAVGVDIAAFMNLAPTFTGGGGEAKANNTPPGGPTVGKWPPPVAPASVIIPKGSA